jgi:DNA-directed RNA polymerase specialized sigma24 family protein
VQPPVDVSAELYRGLLFHADCELRGLGLDRQWAPDLVHEAWLRWLEQGARIRQPERLEAWLRTCIRRLAVDQRRRPQDPLDMLPLSLGVLDYLEESAG